MVIHFLTACTSATPISDQPTPDPIQAFVDANSSQGTAVAAIATADYFSSQLTGTVEARHQAATQQVIDIQGTQMAIQVQSTERAWNATATADAARATTIASQTASAAAQQAIWTQRAIDITSTADSASVQAYATQQYADARNQELSLQRAEWMNGVAALTPWAALITFFFVGMFIVLRWARVRVIPRDTRGDAPLLLNVVDGVAYDADRHPAGAGGFLRDDLKALPQLTADHYLQTTARDQLVDLKTRGLPGASRSPRLSKPKSNAMPAFNGEAPQVQLLDAKDAQPLMHDVVPIILRDAIDAEIIAEEPTKGDPS